MTPVHLNSLSSPFQPTDQKEEQRLHLYLHSSYVPASSSLSCPTQEQRMIKLEDQKAEQYCIAHIGSRDDLQTFSSSFSSQPTMNNKTTDAGEGSISENGSSSKWMSTKMRVMQKMMNSNCTGTHETLVKIKQKLDDNNEEDSFNNSNNTVRVCADCNTTTTPLWRSGPRGPKSLCNACGIRQRKARRAMEAAAAAGNDTIAATDNPCTKIMLHCKEKKWRTNHVAQYKKRCKSSDPLHHRSQRKLFFKDFALSWSKNSALKQVFPQDVEEAAILLMELSCGVIHS